MTEINPTRTLISLFVGTACLILGQGLLLGLVPSSMNVRGFGAASAALVGSAYFLGFLLGAWNGGRMIREIGHIRSYGGLIALIIVSVLALPLLPMAWAWIILRLLHGFAAGGAFLAIEAWLSSAAGVGSRGRVLATYMVITLGGLGGAQLLAGTSPAVSPLPFMLGGILFAASIVPVVLTRIDAPVVQSAARLSLKEVYRHSPFALATSLAAGMCIGVFWTFGPFVGREMGLDAERTSLLVATTVLTGLVLQWPAGFASDRFDRRQIVVVIAIVGVAASLVLITSMVPGRWLLLHICFAALGGYFCLYPLTMAHAIDHTTEPSMAVAISQGLLMANGMGQTIGPLVAGPIIAVLGPRGFPIYFAVLLGVIAIYSARRLVVGVPIAPKEQQKHVFIRTTTPAGTVLDPRVNK